MSLRAVRLSVAVICVAGIAGMIVTSILDHVGAAITFGMISAVAVLCSIVATAVANGPGGPPGTGPPHAGSAVDERQARLVEDLVGDLVVAGADEGAVRRLVREAVRLGRSSA